MTMKDISQLCRCGLLALVLTTMPQGTLQESVTGPDLHKLYGQWNGRQPVIDNATATEPLFSIINDTAGARGKLAYAVLTDMRDARGTFSILSQINKNLRPWTPGDLVVFHTGELDDSSLQQQVKAVVPDVILNRIEDHHWQLPQAVDASLHKSWHGNHGISYRHMCRWWSNGIFQSLKQLGYQWVWRLDEDSQVPEPVQREVISGMVASNQLYAFRMWAWDSVYITWSLPEIASWFISAHKLPLPWIVRHCQPRNMTGLYTGGWERMIFSNNIFIANVDFWMQPLVQNYMAVLSASHGYYLWRWGDAPVHTMVAGIFLQWEQVAKLDFPYCHGKSPFVFCWAKGSDKGVKQQT